VIECLKTALRFGIKFCSLYGFVDELSDFEVKNIIQRIFEEMKDDKE